MDAGKARTGHHIVAVVLLWLVMFIAFVLIQFRVSMLGATYNEGVHGPVIDGDGVWFDLALGVLRYLGASLVMLALIFGRGRRVTFALPILMTVWLPAIFGGAFDCLASGQSAGPHGLGAAWSRTVAYQGCGYAFLAGWGGAAVDLGLVLVPAIAMALLAGRLEVPVRSRVGVASQLIAASVCFIALVFLTSLYELFGYPISWTPWLPIYAPLVVFGALLGLRRSWWSLSLLVVPLTLFPLQAALPFSFDPGEVATLVAITLTAAAWMPLATLLDKARPALARLSRREVAVPAGS
jgi:hypothetical protein